MTLAQFSYDQISKALLVLVILAGFFLLTPYMGIHLFRSPQPTTSQGQPRQQQRHAPRTLSPQQKRPPTSDFSDIENLLQ